MHMCSGGIFRNESVFKIAPDNFRMNQCCILKQFCLVTKSTRMLQMDLTHNYNSHGK